MVLGKFVGKGEEASKNSLKIELGKSVEAFLNSSGKAEEFGAKLIQLGLMGYETQSMPSVPKVTLPSADLTSIAELNKTEPENAFLLCRQALQKLMSSQTPGAGTAVLMVKSIKLNKANEALNK